MLPACHQAMSSPIKRAPLALPSGARIRAQQLLTADSPGARSRRAATPYRFMSPSSPLSVGHTGGGVRVALSKRPGPHSRRPLLRGYDLPVLQDSLPHVIWKCALRSPDRGDTLSPADLLSQSASLSFGSL